MIYFLLKKKGKKLSTVSPSNHRTFQFYNFMNRTCIHMPKYLAIPSGKHISLIAFI